VKIYSMTATFGKLEHQTLTLQPGLNIIEAPNEWGKSTWCAFLVAMLYGIDTKARTTQSILADKEHYAPWSGAPMEGRMDICWNGRDITLERRTRGRLIFGEFRAYETESGLDVPELTAANCGMELLGVERCVFVRAGFLKMTDLPVTQDDALRRRLNNLVTTGDESGAGEKLAQTLKDLKNKCRYNRGGLLPQAEAERDKLEEQLHGLQELNIQAQRIRERQQELDAWMAKLQNHKIALQYAQAQEELQHIKEAIAARDSMRAQVEQQAAVCAALPPETEAERVRVSLQKLHNESMSLQMEQQMLPGAPVRPDAPKYFEGMTGEQAKEQVSKDIVSVTDSARKQKKHKTVIGMGIAILILGALAAAGAFVLEALQILLLAAGGGIAVLGLVLLFAGSHSKKKQNRVFTELTAKYGSVNTSDWRAAAEEFATTQLLYEKEAAQYEQVTAQFHQRKEELLSRIQTLTEGENIAACLEKWENISAQWKVLGDARRDLQRMESQIAALQALTKDVPAPVQPDELSNTLSETDALLSSAAFEQKQNQLRLGQFQGQADALGQESALRLQLRQVRARIEKLEETYQALEVAQRALSSATSELQRRFAPRISRRAQELFGKLTGGRYQKMTLGEDLSVHISAQQEDTLRPSQWRSDGTVDQLYLALRLAVAEELTPEAPLILDDAMVRFDDTRLKTAVHILEEMAEHKQVILFTCQGRENSLRGEGQ